MKIFKYILSSILLMFLANCGGSSDDTSNNISSRDLNSTTMLPQSNYVQISGEHNVSDKAFSTTKEGESGIRIEGGVLYILDSVIHCPTKDSNGIWVSSKGSVNASNIDLTITGESSSAVAFGEGGGVVNIKNSNIILTQDNAPLIKVDTTATAITMLDGVDTTISSGILMKIDYDNRRKTDGTTGILTLIGIGTTYTGSVIVSKHSIAKVIVNKGVAWQGAFNADNSAKSTSLTIDGGTWILSGDSNVDSITLQNDAVISKAGYSLTYKNLTNTSGTISD